MRSDERVPVAPPMHQGGGMRALDARFGLLETIVAAAMTVLLALMLLEPVLS
jgi:hypothetical protein